MEHSQSDPNAIAAYATVRLWGDALVPDEVTTALGMEPTHVHRRGDRHERNARVMFDSGMWSFSSEGQLDSLDLDDHLRWLVDSLIGARDELVRLRDNGTVEGADAFCYWVSRHGHGGPSISPYVLERLGALRLTLDIDFYDGSDEDGGR